MLDGGFAVIANRFVRATDDIDVPSWTIPPTTAVSSPPYGRSTARAFAVKRRFAMSTR